MTLLQEEAVQMIYNMSDDDIAFLIEIIQRLKLNKTGIRDNYQSQKADKKMQAFNELVASINDTKRYLTDDFESEVELEMDKKN